MEAKRELTPAERKAVLIKGFVEVLKKHCEDDSDLMQVIFAITSPVDLMYDIGMRCDIIHDSRMIEKYILKGGGDHDILDKFHTISDFYTESMITSPGLSLDHAHEERH